MMLCRPDRAPATGVRRTACRARQDMGIARAARHLKNEPATTPHPFLKHYLSLHPLPSVGMRAAPRHLPANADALRLGEANAADHHNPEPGGQCRDLINGGTAIAREEGVELLLDDEPE